MKLGQAGNNVLASVRRVAVPLAAVTLCLLSSLAARADQYTAVITVTNAAMTNSSYIVVNSSTNFWVTNVTSAATQTLIVTNNVNYAATNLFQHYANYPLAVNINLGRTTPSNITLTAVGGATLSIITTGNWATVSITTNVQTSLSTVRVPISGEPSAAQRTNVANYLAAGLNSYATTQISGSVATGQVSGATATALVTATQTLNTAVAALNTATNTLTVATNTINAAVIVLNTSTATLNTAVAALNTATNTLTVATNHLAAVKVTTNAALDALRILDSGAQTNLNASNLASGSVPAARFALTTIPYHAIRTNGGATGQAIIFNATDNTWTNGNPTATSTNITTAGPTATNSSTTWLQFTGSGIASNVVTGVTNLFYVTGGGGTTNDYTLVYNTNAISIANNTTTVMTFNGEVEDGPSQHSTASNTDRITITRAGLIELMAWIRFASNNTGHRQVFFRTITSGGATTNVYSVTTITATQGNPTDLGPPNPTVRMAVGDYAQLCVLQASGGNLDVESAQFYTPYFGAIWKGP